MIPAVLDDLAPRVCSYPPYASSAGAEAVELSASAGLQLDPWQAFVLERALGERPDGRWSAFEVACIVSRQNGKGSILESRALAGLLLFDERLIMWTAHEMKTAMEAFRRVEALFDSCPDLRKRVKSVSHANGNEGIELRSGARLRFVARSKGSGRGFSGDLVILDEAYALTSEQLEALMPTMSARPNPQIWYTSSPPLDSTTGAQLFSVRARAVQGTDPSLAYMDWGIDGDLANLSAIDLDDRTLWAASNPAYGIRVSEEFISRERAAMSPEGFARERLGVWPAAPSEGWQVISESAWAARTNPNVGARPENPVAFSIDVTPDRKWASIAVAGELESGGVHLEVVEHRAGTGWVAERMRELVERYEPCAVVLDPAGPAGSLIAALGAVDVDLETPSAREIGQACGQLFDGICGETPSMWHTGQPELTTALAGAETRPLGDAWAWARKNVTVDISPLVAVTLAAWGFQVHGADQVPLVAWR